MKKNQNGFTEIKGLLVLIIIILLSLTGWYVWHHRVTKTTSTGITATKVNGIATFSGKVTADDCAIRTPTIDGSITTTLPPIGDVGCSITVNNVAVQIVHGNIQANTWGNLIRFKYSTNIIGKQVEVRATKNSDTQFSLSSNNTYVKILN